jgi:hypothetical protein
MRNIGSQSEIGYGAGQQTVLVKDGKLWMWYTDDSLTPDPGETFVRYHTYFLKSDNPVSWDVTQRKEILINDPKYCGASQNPCPMTGVHSVDIKYRPSDGKFVMYRIVRPHNEDSHLVRYFSSDGIIWNLEAILFDANDFPNYAHNVGVESDENGWLVSSAPFVGFGAPFDMANHKSWGHWDLFGRFVP